MDNITKTVASLHSAEVDGVRMVRQRPGLSYFVGDSVPPMDSVELMSTMGD